MEIMFNINIVDEKIKDIIDTVIIKAYIIEFKINKFEVYKLVRRV